MDGKREGREVLVVVVFDKKRRGARNKKKDKRERERERMKERKKGTHLNGRIG